MKAQISIEHSALLAVVLSILVVGFAYMSSISSQYHGYAFRALSANEGSKLAEAIDIAPSLGTGSRQKIVLDLPEEFQKAYTVGNRLIVFELSTDKGIEHVVFATKYDILQDAVIQDLTPGKHVVYVTAEASGVCISPNGYCGAECGDGVASINETCDLDDHKGQTCVDQGSPGGTLICNSDCGGFDTTLCN